MQHQQHPIYAHRASFFGPRPIRVDNTRIPGIASGVGRHDSIPDRFKIRRTGVLSHAGYCQRIAAGTRLLKIEDRAVRQALHAPDGVRPSSSQCCC